jgi:putative transposase
MGHSVTTKEHRLYPYLLRSTRIEQPSHAWYTGIAYVPLANGCPYLVAIMAKWSRKVPAWRLSNAILPIRNFPYRE